MDEFFFYDPDKVIKCPECKMINYYTSYIHELGKLDIICPECLNKFINEDVLITFTNKVDNKIL